MAQLHVARLKAQLERRLLAAERLEGADLAAAWLEIERIETQLWWSAPAQRERAKIEALSDEALDALLAELVEMDERAVRRHELFDRALAAMTDGQLDELLALQCAEGP